MAWSTVDSYDDVVENVRRFNEDLKEPEPDPGQDLAGLLGYFRAWYYIPELDLVGPSKFIGYKGMSAHSYMEEDDLDGRVSEPVLGRWFDVQTGDSVEAEFIYDIVQSLLKVHGRAPSRLARVCAPRGWTFAPGHVGEQGTLAKGSGGNANGHNPMVEVFWRAFQTLYPDDQRTLAERIARLVRME